MNLFNIATMLLHNLAFFTCIFIVLDFVTGGGAAAFLGEWTSKDMRKGIFHKASEIALIILGYLFQYVQNITDLGIGTKIPTGKGVCILLIIMEVGSIIENICKVNPNIMPEKVLAILGMNKE